MRSTVEVLALLCIFYCIFFMFFCVCSFANNFLCMSFFAYFVFGWLKFERKEKKEEPLLPAQWDSSFRLLAMDEEAA